MPESLFNKVADLRPATLLKKGLWGRCFPVNFAKFLGTPFYIEHLWWLLLNLHQGRIQLKLAKTFNCSQNLLHSRSGIYLVKNINTAPDLSTKFTLFWDIFFFSFTATTARSMICCNYITNSRKNILSSYMCLLSFHSEILKAFFINKRHLGTRFLHLLKAPATYIQKVDWLLLTHLFIWVINSTKLSYTVAKYFSRVIRPSKTCYKVW